jgi:CelD/BcsL family acetyltransferase involved in cellulose biosynthesis
MRTIAVDPLADPRWLALASSTPGASVFHHPTWLELVRHTYGYGVFATCAIDRAGRLVAGLPLVHVTSRLSGRRLVAVPFADLCGPLVLPDAPETALGAVAAAAERERERRGCALEVRERLPGTGAAVELFHRHVIDLSAGADAAEKRCHPRARRNTRKARREGVTVERRTDRAALDAFYALHLQTRRRLGVPTQPRRFIRGLERLFAADLGYVALARHEERPVAAAVFLRGSDGLLYKYGASDPTALTLRPNNVLFSDVIRWAADDGLTSLDLGRTDLASQGLRDFKCSLGADETPLAYTYAGGNGPSAARGRATRTLAGVIRRSPPVVSRVVGEVLYRHAA